MRYGLGFKETQAKKVLPPHNRPIALVARDAGISDQTLRNWLEQAKNGTLKKQDPVGGVGRSAREKFNLIMESKSVSENDHGKWLREKGTYIACESTFSRVLREERFIKHRCNFRPGRSLHTPPELVATGSNKVWHGISHGSGPIFVEYSTLPIPLLNIRDRSIVKWSIHDREDDEYARELFQAAFEENDYPNVFVHSDNGNPMKGMLLMALFYDLGISLTVIPGQE